MDPIPLHILEREEIRKKINSLFDNNQLDDLQRFFRKRQTLNGCNVYMLYLFHFIQSIGILVTSYGTSVNDSNIIWSGVSLNVLASLIQIYEKINNAQLKKLLNDIKAIKDDKYVDESAMVDPDKDLSASLNRSQTMTNKEDTPRHSSPPAYVYSQPKPPSYYKSGIVAQYYQANPENNDSKT
jgi:hypothetical protein